MLIARTLILLLLLASAVSFALYAFTSDLRYRRFGLAVLKWTVAAGLLFFAGMIIERMT